MKDLPEFSSRKGVGWFKGYMSLVLLVSLTSCCLAASSQRVGGPCNYKQYRGEAEIISVNPRQTNPVEYEITFSFHPHDTIQEEFARVEGKQWLLVQRDSSYPKEDFLKQYNIKTGRRLPCFLKVITKGTCTPVLFDLPTVENGKVQ